MLLSVLSALARLELDPWQEAAKLARLPAAAATRRLASLLAALPDGARGKRDFSTVAARLIALLPRRATSRVTTPIMAAAVVPASRFRVAMWVIVGVLIFALAAELTSASHRSQGPNDGDGTPTSSVTAPRPAPSSFAR